MSRPKYCPECGALLKYEEHSIADGFDPYTGKPKFNESASLICSKADVEMFYRYYTHEFDPSSTQEAPWNTRRVENWRRPNSGACLYIQVAAHAFVEKG